MSETTLLITTLTQAIALLFSTVGAFIVPHKKRYYIALCAIVAIVTVITTRSSQPVLQVHRERIFASGEVYETAKFLCVWAYGATESDCLQVYGYDNTANPAIPHSSKISYTFDIEVDYASRSVQRSGGYTRTIAVPFGVGTSPDN